MKQLSIRYHIITAMLLSLFSLPTFSQELFEATSLEISEQNTAELIKQEVLFIEEEGGRRFLHMTGDISDQFATLDCQSFFHELKFFDGEDELINYRLPSRECNELYEDLIYRVQKGKSTCLAIAPRSFQVYVFYNCKQSAEKIGGP